MTPEQRLYCHALRICRGNGLSLSEARANAHNIVGYFVDSPTGFLHTMELFPSYPWDDILSPSSHSKDTNESPHSPFDSLPGYSS